MKMRVIHSSWKHLVGIVGEVLAVRGCALGNDDTDMVTLRFDDDTQEMFYRYQLEAVQNEQSAN